MYTPDVNHRLAAYLLLTIPIFAQTRAPRMGGKPDLSGVWQPNSSIPGSWEEANSGLGVGGTGTNPNAPAAAASGDRQGRPPAPYQPWAAKKVLESFNNRAIDDPAAQCLPIGIPRVNSVQLFPLQIIQTPTQIVMLYEYMNSFRVIPLNAKHNPDATPTYFGDAAGHWEGDTLVVDVNSFNDKTWLIGSGTFHSDELHVVERYTRVSKDQINYEATMEDPKVLTGPWKFQNTFMLREGTRIGEYPCAENNIDPNRYEQLLKEGVSVKRP